MICDLCKTAFISRGSIRVVKCACGGTHRACLTCRRAMERHKLAHYEGNGMALEECPIAYEVAYRLMEGGDGG